MTRPTGTIGSIPVARFAYVYAASLARRPAPGPLAPRRAAGLRKTARPDRVAGAETGRTAGARRTGRGLRPQPDAHTRRAEPVARRGAGGHLSAAHHGGQPPRYRRGAAGAFPATLTGTGDRTRAGRTRRPGPGRAAARATRHAASSDERSVGKKGGRQY